MDGKKVIFLDIDGTLTVPGRNQPPAGAMEAVRRARQAGHKVFLSSGRSLGMLSPLLNLGFDGAVASAGGYILCGDQVLYDHPMTQAQLNVARDILRRHEVYHIIEARDAAFGEGDMAKILAAGDTGDSEFMRWQTVFQKELGVRPMAEYDGRPIYKVVCMYRDPAQLEEARTRLEAEFQFCGQSFPTRFWRNTELINRAFDKGRGVAKVCQYLGVDLRDAAAFGDGPNDMEMIRTVGTGVAMGNACPELKAAANLVCPPAEENGLAEGFRMLHLI